MKKDAGSNCQDMKNQRFIVRIAAGGYLVVFLITDLNQMET